MNLTDYSKYFLMLAAATLATFFFHEMSHWLAYEALGYNAGFTLNGASLKDSSVEMKEIHRMITSASGPIFTLIQAFVFYALLIRKNNVMLYPFLFLPFIMRLGAGWANQFEPNDEGRISLFLGLNLYALSAIVVAFLFLLIFKVSRKNGYSLLFNIGTFIVAAILLFALVYIDAKIKVRFV